MAAYDALVKLVVKKLYGDSYPVTVGTFNPVTVYHKQANPSISKTVPNLCSIIPDECFKPEVMVCFDFLSTYTLDLPGKPLSEAQRLVPAAVLKNAAARIYGFYKYYFDSTNSYGKKKSKKNNALNIYGESEAKLNEILNIILNYFFMNATVDKSLNQTGTCSLRFSDNSYTSGCKRLQILYDTMSDVLSQLFVPMVPISIWAKGRLYKDYYVPLFTGVITSTEFVNSAGFAEISLRCKDVLELARISQEMVNPALMPQGEIISQSYINIISTPLTGNGHKEIFKTMFKGGGLAYKNTTKKVIAETAKPGQDTKTSLIFSRLGDFKFYDSGDNVDLVNQAMEESCGVHKDQFSISVAIEKISSNHKKSIITWGNDITPYRVFENQNPDTFFSSFESRLSIIQKTAELVYFNFYVDGLGNVHYHPMCMANSFLEYDTRYAVRVSKNHKHMFPHSQVISGEETFSLSKQINVDELITHLVVGGRDNYIGDNKDNSAFLGMIGKATDWVLMRRFGYRRAGVDNPLLNVGKLELPGLNGKKVAYVDYVAYSLLKYMNSELHNAQISMVFRPELRLGLPIFIEPDGDVFYVQSISHSITVNGEATTTVNANFGRKEEASPPDLFSYMVMSEKLYKDPGSAELNATPPVFTTVADLQTWYEQHFSGVGLGMVQYILEMDRIETERLKFMDEQLNSVQSMLNDGRK